MRVALLSATVLAGCATLRVQPVATSVGDTVDWSAFEEGAIVYLDVVVPAEEGCHTFGPELQGEGPVSLPTGDNHLLVYAHRGDPGRFPFNGVGCAYAPGQPSMSALRVRGFYAVLTSSIPTAVQVDLRPVEVDPVQGSKVIRSRTGG